MKSFSEQEREIIKRKLLECCEESWSKYGYKKTNIRELCEAAGISTGAFYMFFPSKEHLFFETAQYVGDRIDAVAYKEMPEKPTKQDFARALKKMFKEFEKVEWYLRLEDELALIVRKLPPGYIGTTSTKDMADLAKLIAKFRLVPKIDMEKLIKVLSVLSMSILHKNLLGEGFEDAFAFLLDSAVENMFV